VLVVAVLVDVVAGDVAVSACFALPPCASPLFPCATVLALLVDLVGFVAGPCEALLACVVAPLLVGLVVGPCEPL
jgi:hypothetical protein